MKCPNCGEEMAESALYCEHCGEDIHIVPDFEPELEQNIQQIISGIMEELDEPLREEPEGTREVESDPEPGLKPKKRWKWLLPTILAVLIFGASLGMGVWVYLHNSREYQVRRAEQYVALGNYDRAISHYKRALALDENDIELQFSLAEVYFLKNNKIEYEYLLRDIARNENATMEQLDRAYGKLIAIYRAREDYDTINQLILGSGNDQMISTYQNYIANPPEFSVIEGYYTSIQPLKLTAMGSGSIYYTMDGSDPDENSTQYTMPIILEKGEYVVTAVFVNDNGIYSEIIRKEYFIDNDDIPEPEISIVSGEYYVPVYIEVLELEEDEEVYYTTDGTIPSYSSNRYTEPIPMPLGSSRYMFARIVDGVTGEVAERNYVLVLNTENTPEQAVQSIRGYALDTGRISDEAGHFDDSGAMYIYEYLYVANINEVSDFFVIAEVQREADGAQVRTGNFYAVNVYDSTRYRLQRDERDRFVLSVID